MLHIPNVPGARERTVQPWLDDDVQEAPSPAWTETLLPLRSEPPEPSPGLGEVLYVRLKDVCLYLLGATSVVILTRFVLVASAARDTPFLRLMVTLSHPLLVPFAGLFSTMPVNGQGTLELDDLAAVIAYALAAWLVCGVLRLILLPVARHRPTRAA